MATQTVKTTYSLDLETVRALEELARRWNVSKSEALRRAIRATAIQQPLEAQRKAVTALDELQRALGLSDGAAARWQKAARVERGAASRRREARAR
jgi:predicted transcriptional regulator